MARCERGLAARRLHDHGHGTGSDHTVGDCPRAGAAHPRARRRDRSHPTASSRASSGNRQRPALQSRAAGGRRRARRRRPDDLARHRRGRARRRFDGLVPGDGDQHPAAERAVRAGGAPRDLLQRSDRDLGRVGESARARRRRAGRLPRHRPLVLRQRLHALLGAPRRVQGLRRRQAAPAAQRRSGDPDRLLLSEDARAHRRHLGRERAAGHRQSRHRGRGPVRARGADRSRRSICGRESPVR